MTREELGDELRSAPLGTRIEIQEENNSWVGARVETNICSLSAVKLSAGTRWCADPRTANAGAVANGSPGRRARGRAHVGTRRRASSRRSVPRAAPRARRAFFELSDPGPPGRGSGLSEGAKVRVELKNAKHLVEAPL